MRNKARTRGMTLLQLIVIGSVVAVASSAAIAFAVGSRYRQNMDNVRGDLHTLARAIDLYQLDVGTWPGAHDGLESLIFDNGAHRWNGPYLTARDLPLDPWGNHYRYDAGGKRGTYYDLYSAGPDGVARTPDDIGNW